MKNRREFLKIFGMLTAAGAAFTTVGVMAKPVLLGAVDTETCVKTPTKIKAYHVEHAISVPKENLLDDKWLESEEVIEEWRKVWAEEAKDKFLHHWLTPDIQKRMIDNVFQNSPMIEYLKNKDTMVLNPDTIISTGHIDVSHFGPVTTSSNADNPILTWDWQDRTIRENK